MLQNLVEAFKHHAGADSRIDVAELQKSLEIRNEYLARRMLRVFDTNGDGVVSREEFLEGVRRLVFGSVREKLKFAFRIHDLNDDQVIERKELLEMITLSMAEENAACSLRDADRLTDLVMKAADRSGDGRVTYREFEQVMFQHKQLLELITRSEAQWIAPNEDLLSHMAPRVSRLERFRRYLDNHLAQVLLFAIWAGINAALFSHAFATYAGSGPLVQLARGCGACLNLNGALIFVPVMRRLLTRARRTPVLRELPIDDALGMHRFLGSAVVGLGLVHSAAHLANNANGAFGKWVSGFYPATGLALLVLLVVMWLGS
ncbi:MAG TPA: EF-hand domain-containing protein, partial [Polyangiales bacterium]|nr:EF-hand domain-containing protein [Polyangiales bacterium]